MQAISRVSRNNIANYLVYALAYLLYLLAQEFSILHNVLLT